MSQVLLAVGFGVVTASILSIAAVGFTLQFGVTNVFNLAYGDTMTASAFLAYFVTTAHWGLWAAVVVAGAFGAVYSLALNRFVYTPFIHRGARLFSMVIVSIGVSLIMSNGLQAIFGASYVSLDIPVQRELQLGPFALTGVELAFIGIALSGMAIVHVVLRYTRLGRAMRATSTNATLARNCGISTDRVVDAVWLLSGCLCGIAGVALVVDVSTFNPTTGDQFIIPILAVAVLGGLGQAYGAMVAALVVGVATEVSAVVISPEYKEVVAFGILVIILVIRPQGIFSEIVAAKEVVT